VTGIIRNIHRGFSKDEIVITKLVMFILKEYYWSHFSDSIFFKLNFKIQLSSLMNIFNLIITTIYYHIFEAITCSIKSTFVKIMFKMSRVSSHFFAY